MYKRILSAVNGHLNSEAAARYALGLARASDAKVYFVFAAEKGLSPSAVKAAEESLQRLFQSAIDLSVRSETVSETGDPVRIIGRIAKGEEVEIALISARRPDIERRFYAGTVARRLLIGLPCPTALVRVVHMGRIHPKKILVPLKARITHPKERAYFVSKMAEAFGSSVAVFHVRRPLSKFFHGELHLAPPELEKSIPEDVAAFIGLLERYDVSHSANRSPGRSIMVEAASKKHDLIVMGASGRSLLSSVFRGNPVEEVLRETPCDLIIFRP